MKKNIIGAFLLLMIAITATAQKIPDYVRINRTACFGRCPVYSVEVYKSGLVRYSGQMFTEHQGVYQKKISRTRVASLMKKIAAYSPDTCKDNYNKMIPDVPGIFMVFGYGNDQKKINNADSGPAFLKTLAQSVDELGLVDKSWKKVADTAILKYR